jgi:hypothetical protein
MNWRAGIRALAAFWVLVGACVAIAGTILFLAANGYQTVAALLMLAVMSALVFWIVATLT